MPLNYTLEKTVQMASSISAYFQQLKGEKEERKPIVYSGRHPMKIVIRESSLQLMAAPSESSRTWDRRSHASPLTAFRQEPWYSFSRPDLTT